MNALDGVTRALVVGSGSSGVAAARALVATGVAVVVADVAHDVPAASELGALGVEVHAASDGSAEVGRVDLVVPSPGVRESAAVLVEAQRRDIAIWSEPELGWRLAPRRTVAVTGTNGKTSVTELTTAMLNAAGISAVACGNIGHAYTDAALDAARDDVLVAELSSFQLRYVTALRAEVGALLNLAPDHLDWHGSLAGYAAAKARIWAAQEPGDAALANSDDAPAAALVREHARGRTVWFSGREVPGRGVGVRDGVLVARLESYEGPVVTTASLRTVAPHHIENVAAAAAAALLVGAPVDAIAATAAAYAPGAHRLQVVARGRGVTWVDDSKATNPHAAAAALRGSGGVEGAAVIWIAGGLAKGIDLAPLADELDRVRHAVLIGEAAEALARVAAAAGVPTSIAPGIEAAVEIAAGLAAPGDVVLLAPACASFDQFRDYAERGDRFAAAAREAARAPRVCGSAASHAATPGATPSSVTEVRR